jgi:hypothetical protein
MNVIASTSIPNKYLRYERWDMFIASLQELFNDYENAVDNPVTPQHFEDNAIAELENKGARKMEAQLMADKPPRYQLRGVTKTGFLSTKISVHEDGSVSITQE